MNNNNPNIRIFIAVILSIMFIIPYMYFFAPKTELKDSNATMSSMTNILEGNKDTKIEAPKNNQNSIKAPKETDSTLIIAKVESSDIEMKIDNLGRIDSVLLKGKKYLNDNGEPLSLLDNKAIKPLEIRFENKEINNKAFNTPYKADIDIINIDNESKKIVLTQNLGKIEGFGEIIVKKIITFYKNLKFDVEIELNKPLNYYISNGSRPIADSSSYVFKGIIIKKSDNKLEKIEDGDNIEINNFNNVKFIASVDRYYTTLLFSENGLNAVIDNVSDGKHLSYIFLNDSAKFSGYIGPKNYKDLKSIEPLLTDVVEYGVITFFAKPLFLLLEWLFGIFKNWGWAIILLTLIVRIVLYPLTYKGMVSMQKLKDLAPKMKEIQTKYKGDAQKLQIHMMELYKKHKVNPMGGCLPLLLQIPVFFAIYRVLYNAVELKDATWILWIKDLSAMDPYFILPILMGVTMYLQQHITPATFNDPMQEKVFKFLPVVFTIFLITFPAGLILYWTVNNIFSIIQQLIINKVMAKKKEIEIAQHKRKDK
ncbi:membrane protein insertase YidC [Helicobacter sp. MIT 14-3879]|uniref:membrane protein insertase YidC n=1 Tax=Helicobacter sp. MIT 14-3879 TaxID=2040649 RepID=UPI000E1ED841|nr:membrane protein insertase YidC [Helicobacter sp. MIT 14-3879]RDU64838.1 membrane protein insertase YidC [Helicobacter sp. MIT 14-3879]